MKLLPIGATVVVAAFALAPARAQQAGTHEQHEQEHSQTAPPTSGAMDHAKMMAEMKAADARLESLAANMKSAQGDEKIRAMQDLLDQLVQNEISMHREMAMMHDHMMSGMHK